MVTIGELTGFQWKPHVEIPDGPYNATLVKVVQPNGRWRYEAGLCSAQRAIDGHSHNESNKAVSQVSPPQVHT